LNDECAGRTHIHDAIIAQFSGEDAWAERSVSANVDSSEENNESHSGIIGKKCTLARGCIIVPRIRRSISGLTFLHAVFFQPNCIRKTGLSSRARSLSRRNENSAKYRNA
jgi:hypothetical protein